MKKWMLLLLLWSIPCFGEEYKHDGFFLRLAPGVGLFSGEENYDGNKIKIDGESGVFGISIGGALSENLILHADLLGVSTADPKVKYNGYKATLDGDVSTSIFGIGITTYFSSNLYLSGSIGFAKTKLDGNGFEGETDRGFGFIGMVGKEWWVSENWGLGVAGQFMYASCPDEGEGSGDLSTTSVAILFSATYN